MILENASLCVAERFGNVYALVRIESDTTEARIDAVVVVESGEKSARSYAWRFGAHMLAKLLR